MAESNINLSSLISFELKDSRVEFGKGGIVALSMLAKVSPVSEADRNFVEVFLKNQETLPLAERAPL